MSKHAARRFDFTPFDGSWTTMVVGLPNELIQHVCVIFEGYENMAQVRTPVKQGHQVHVMTPTVSVGTVKRILAELSTTVPLEILEEIDGFPDMREEW